MNDKRITSSKLHPGDFFILRSPLFSYNHFSGIFQESELLDEFTDSNNKEARYNAEFLKITSAVEHEWQNPCVTEAVWLASPDLYDALTVSSSSDVDRDRKILSLYRYLARMSFRPTPFGLFAGLSVGHIESKSNLILDSWKNVRRHTRLDMACLFEVARNIVAETADKRFFAVTTNPTLIKVLDRYKYIEHYKKKEQETTSYREVSVEITEYLEGILCRAKEGARIEDLIRWLVQYDVEITEEEALDFVEELCSNKILINGFQPCLTGKDSLEDLLEALKEMELFPSTIHALEQVKKIIIELDKNGLCNDIEYYKSIYNTLHSDKINVEPNHIVQVDLLKPSDKLALGEKIAKEIVKGVEFLFSIRPPMNKSLMDQFRAKFQEQYGNGYVPLLQVLDKDVGIGLGWQDLEDPFLKGLPIGLGRSTENAVLTSRDIYLLYRINENIYGNSPMVLALSDKDIEALRGNDDRDIPEALVAVAKLVATSKQALDQGKYNIFLSHCLGPSGAQYLGRFCHCSDELDSFVREHIRREEELHPEAIYAEIVNTTEERHGNVIFRSVFREYEISIFGKGGASSGKQIPLSDLLVSVQNNRVVLYSKKLEREIKPRLSSAHNFYNSELSVYKFLAMIQYEGFAFNLAWSWGNLASNPFLPRVTYGRYILCPAAWRLSKREISRLCKNDGFSAFLDMQEFRDKRGMPRFVVLADGDNEFPVDLNAVISVKVLLDLIKNRNTAIITEMIPRPDEMIVRSQEGPINHEIVLPINDSKASSVGSVKPPITLQTIERQLFPASECLFLKIYGSEQCADSFLKNKIAPIAEKMLAKGAISRFFFIRYADPDWHIRLRFYGDSTTLLTTVLLACKQVFAEELKTRLIKKWEIATYDREVERYGGPHAISVCEELFQWDSIAVLKILQTISKEELTSNRWRICAKGMDSFLNDFGLDLKAKQTLMEILKNDFEKEYRASGNTQHAISKKYRKDRDILEKFLFDKTKKASWEANVIEIFHERSVKMMLAIQSLRDLERAGMLSVSLDEILGSILHMHMNRMWSYFQRPAEMVLYTFLFKAYRSELAKRIT